MTALAQRDIARLARSYEATSVPTEWTEDHVKIRLVEALTISARTEKRPGPRLPGNNHPALALTHAERWQSILRQLEGLYEEGDYKGYSSIELFMRKIEAESRHTVDPDEVERTDEAIGWLARYLADDALMADALSTWAFCTAFGRSIEDLLADRREAADWLIERLEAQERVRAARRSGARNPFAASSPYHRQREALRILAAKRAEWANERIGERTAELTATLAALPKRARTKAGEERLERKRTAAERKAAAYVKRIRRSAGILARREAIATGAVEAKPHVLGLTRRDVMPGLIFKKTTLWEKLHQAATALADALNRDGTDVR